MLDDTNHLHGRCLRQKWAQDEAAQVEQDHRSAVVALEAALEVERNRCKDLRTRLDRQMREHQTVLTDSEQKLLQTQQDLDKVRAIYGSNSDDAGLLSMLPISTRIASLLMFVFIFVVS